MMWMFPKIGVGKPPKWMVYFMENPIKMDVYTIIFGNTHVYLFLITPTLNSPLGNMVKFSVFIKNSSTYWCVFFFSQLLGKWYQWYQLPTSNNSTTNLAKLQYFTNLDFPEIRDFPYFSPPFGGNRSCEVAMKFAHFPNLSVQMTFGSATGSGTGLRYPVFLRKQWTVVETTTWQPLGKTLLKVKLLVGYI